MALAQKKDRIEFRIEETSKLVIERAASILGQTLTAYASTTLLKDAEDVVTRYERVVLSDRDRDHFLQLLDAEAQPNEALINAAKTYKANQG